MAGSLDPRRVPSRAASHVAVNEGAVLGVNAWHGDSAACLLIDGHLVAAAEEERFRRVKHWAGFPSEATSGASRS